MNGDGIILRFTANMKTKMFKICLILCWFLFIQPIFVTAQSVTIEMDSTRQLIRGFGGIQIPVWAGTELDDGLSEKAFGNDPGKLGLTILRLRIDPDSNQFYRELPMAQYAVDKGAIVFASPWNPPAEMLDPESELRRLHEDYYDDYVEHLNRYNSYMGENGVPLYAISVQNEPDWGNSWTRWTAAEMIKFLEENGMGIETRVLAPESYQFKRPYTDSILNDPEASANLDIVGGHIYGGGLFDYPLAREQGKEVWMTEHYTSSDRSANLWPDALLVGSEITNCMQANFNAYVWWYIRRFYGLITDDGLISKRGYVMSQYSKFVRPGAFRVDATLTAAPGVDASAFKTDSTLVVVVVNSNDSEVNLDFTILNNIGVDTVTQYTTSGTKNVLNDGDIALTGNTFNATVDAHSITTFTSYAEYGGKYNNIPPVADAGPDIITEDSDGNGSEIITLNGKTSSDADGTIAIYSWSLNDQHIAWEDSVEIEIPVGNHVVILAVTDDDGATDTDTLSIEIASIYNTELWAEAECVVVGSNWEILFDENASNGVYVGAPLGTQSVENPSTDTADHLIYEFHVTEAGPYKVWGRVVAPTPDDDSYWVKIDESSWAMWNNIPGGSDWHWDDVHDGGADNNLVYQLDTGYHELSICFREDGTYLDKMLIVNTGLVPSGTGEEGLTCTINPPGPGALNEVNELSEIRVYPNPATDQIQIFCNKGFNSLFLISLDGRIILQNEYPLKLNHATLDLDLEPGVYFLHLSTETASNVVKLIIK